MTHPQRPHSSGELVHLDPGAARDVGAMLARAFYDDPIQTALVPDGNRRAAMLPLSFAALIRATAAAGGRMMTTSDHAAAALWCPPGVRVGTWAMLRANGFGLLRLMKTTPLSTTRTSLHFFATISERQETLAPEPHWYLATLGVDPERQGEGLGTALVRDGLVRADSDGARTYLETETKDNVRFYEAFGFRVVEELVLDRIDVPMWLMVRDPAAREG